jgi:hypothetical protein
MTKTRQINYRAPLLIAAMIVVTAASRWVQADTGTCNGTLITLPFTDVQASNVFFCSVGQAFFTGLTNGTSASTYSPGSPVPREQMAAFITRTMDQSLVRGRRRAALQRWWTVTRTVALHPTDLGTANGPRDIVFDGADLWVSSASSDTVSRVRASDGKLLQTWAGANGAYGIIEAAGRIFITGVLGSGTAGKIWVIDPSSNFTGVVAEFEPNIGLNPQQITFDGINLWTANTANGTSGGSISRINILTNADTTFTAGFAAPGDILWDGANLWVADDQLKRVNPATGQVLESTNVGDGPTRLLFDGTNIWVSNLIGDSIMVVRAVGALRGTVLHTIVGHGLDGPRGMAFDGERVVVCNQNNDSLTLFKAADCLTELGPMSTGTDSTPFAACSDGVNFWLIRTGNNDIVRF